MSDELHNLLRDHIKDTRKFQDDAIKKLSSIETHNQYTAERLDKVESVTEDYKKHKNRIYGVVIALSTLIGTFGSWLKEHIFK